MNVLAEREIETNTTYSFAAAKHAALDAADRCRQAKEMHEDFFNDPDHILRVESTKAIVKDFFNGAKLYVNERGINRKPFTVVKVERPLFPNQLTAQEKEDQLYGPLKAAGVEIVFAKGSNSYLFRIR